MFYLFGLGGVVLASVAATILYAVLVTSAEMDERVDQLRKQRER